MPTLPRKALRPIMAASIVVVAISAAGLARASLLPSGETLPGLLVAGAPIVAADGLEALVHARAEAFLDAKIVLTLPGEGSAVTNVFEGKLRDVGAKIDEANVAARARAIGHVEDALLRIDLAKRAARGELDVPLLPILDGDAFDAVVAKIKEEIDVAPVSARLDLDHHGVVPEKDGLYVDAGAAVSSVADTLREARGDETRFEIPLVRVAFPPRMTAEWVRKLDVHAVLASYETGFSRGGDQARRARNVEVGASKIDGLVMSPGELVSFNAVVGERSEENGFQKSWEIFKGEMVEGVGGGTCQVASTLHAASVFAGIEILERLPHSRPSAYIPMGLDATVVYPAVDMKLRNPYDFPVVVHAVVDGNKLRVDLLGAKKPATVEFSREITKTIPFGRKLDEEPRLRGTTTVVRKQQGIRGFGVKRTRTIRLLDGTTRVEETEDVYPPTNEVYEVPPGFDESLLPGLPEQGDDDDPDAPTPTAAAPTPADPSVEIIEGKGSHTPTAAQIHPPKVFTSRN